MGFVTGTYVGDGAASLAIAGIGFQPKGLILWQQTNNTNVGTPDFKITQDLLNTFYWFPPLTRWNYVAGFNIISLDLDGFTVTGWANNVGVTYSYCVFN